MKEICPRCEQEIEIKVIRELEPIKVREEENEVEVIDIFTNHGILWEEVDDEASLFVQEAARRILKQR